MENDIKVSVCCITFNQERYIRQTLEGFVSQKTTFRFEVLIHDDASTDGTKEIILEYAKRYPEIIKPILQTENQHSKGVKINPTYNYVRAKGKYIAYCEGDDFWSDSQKLQEQFEALENNPLCSICVHKTAHIDKNGKRLKSFFPAVELQEGIISSEDYIQLELVDSPWLFQTSSFFLRREIIEAYLNGFKHLYPGGDLPLVLLSLQFGDCYYIAREMSCYRKDSGGAMSKIRDDNKSGVLHYRRMIEGHVKFDEFTDFKYHTEFQYAINFAQVQIYKLQAKYKYILQPQFYKVFEKLNWKNRILIYFGNIFPKLAFRIFYVMHKINRNG